MKLPNAESAVIERAKLFGYLLSPTHEIGRFKARFFANLGYSQEDWPRLEADLRQQHLSQPTKPGAMASHGRKYEIHAILRGPNGNAAEVVSVWIIRNDEDFPRFVTAYPGGSL